MIFLNASIWFESRPEGFHHRERSGLKWNDLPRAMGCIYRILNPLLEGQRVVVGIVAPYTPTSGYGALMVWADADSRD